MWSKSFVTSLKSIIENLFKFGLYSFWGGYFVQWCTTPNAVKTQLFYSIKDSMVFTVNLLHIANMVKFNLNF